jgi:hypothetical protein
MYRRLVSTVALVIVLSMAAPAFAAPRDPGSNIIDRIILQLKRIFHPLELTDVSPPKP